MNFENLYNSPIKLKNTRVKRNYSGGLLLEKWQNKPNDADGYMPEAFHYDTFTREEILSRMCFKPSVIEKQEGGIITSIISSSHTEFFTIEKLEVSEGFYSKKQNSFSIGVVISGKGKLIGTSRYELKQSDYEQMAEIIKRNSIKYVLFNGGNGSMDTCGKIYRALGDSGINVVGISKTIDNDIKKGMPHTLFTCPNVLLMKKYFLKM